MRGRGRAAPCDAGVVLVDLLVATMVLVALVAMATPIATRVTDAGRARAAAGYVAGRLRLTRSQAVRTGTATALVFDAGSRWSFRVCRDGNDDGVRRADVSAGVDPCGPAETVDERFAGVTIGLDPAVPDLDMATGRSDAVRFGRAAMVSCSPAGHCTPGSLYLQSSEGTQYGLRISGVTGRARRLRFDSGSRAWVPD